MKTKFFVFLLTFLTILLFAGASCKDSENSTPPQIIKEKNNYDIYLLLGQSNMAGRGTITEEYTDTLDGVFLFKNDGVSVWEKAANPLNKYSTVRKELHMQRLGPGYSFAKKMRSYFPKQTIGLVVNAKGGTTISEWKPGGELYNEALKRARDAAADGTIKGILWHQGEGDYGLKEGYFDRLLEIVESFRADLKNDEIPIVAGQILPTNTGKEEFNEILLTISSYIPFSGIVSVEGTTSFDDLHFDTESQISIGERYAEEMHRLLK